jgi:hypothetical protein
MSMLLPSVMWLLSSALPAFSARGDASTHATSDTIWAKDQRGCLLVVERPLGANESVETTVPCVAGKLEGEGVVLFRNGGITSEGYRARRTAGLWLEKGVRRMNAYPEQWKIHMLFRGCKDYRVQAKIEVADSLAFDQLPFYEDAMKMAHDSIRRRCPEASYIKSTDDAMTVSFVLGPPNDYDTNLLAKCSIMLAPGAECYKWQNLNTVLNEHQAWIAAVQRGEMAKRAEAGNRATAANEARSRDDRLARLRALLSQHKAVGVGVEALQRNPYPFVGKTVALFTVFQGMRNGSTALFGSTPTPPSLVVRGTPSDKFREHVDVLLTARVVGQNEEIFLGSRISVPLLSYVDAYFCQKQGCAEIRP